MSSIEGTQSPTMDFRARLAAMLPVDPMAKKPVKAITLHGEKFMTPKPYNEAEFPFQLVERRQ